MKYGIIGTDGIKLIGTPNETPVLHSLQLSTSPILPVVLVHGYNDSANSWATYVNALLPSIGRIGYAVDTLDTGKDDYVALTIDENALRLKEYITKVKEETHAKQVDIVAHSMGGLISRMYIADFMDRNAPDVHQLIMLGTPNGGSNSARLLEIAHSFGLSSLFQPTLYRKRNP